MSEIPQTQVALQFVGADETRLNTEKPVPELGPTQILCQIEATGICFSDTKLMHAFTAHPRKGEVRTFLTPEELAVPGRLAEASPAAISNPSDNLKNLFELPILFYLGVLLSLVLMVQPSDS